MTGANSDPFDVTCDTHCWVAEPSMTTGVVAPVAGAVNGTLFTFGGFVVSGGNLQSIPSVQAYDPVTKGWTLRAPMPTPRFDFGVGVVNGVLYTVGGFSVNEVSHTVVAGSSVVEVFDPSTDSWTTRAPMPTPRYGASVAVVNGVLYALGGQAQAIDAYDARTNSWTTRSSAPFAGEVCGVAVVNGLLHVAARYGSTSTLMAYDPLTNQWTIEGPMPSTLYCDFGFSAVNGVLYATGGTNGSGKALTRVRSYAP